MASVADRMVPGRRVKTDTKCRHVFYRSKGRQGEEVGGRSGRVGWSSVHNTDFYRAINLSDKCR